MNTSYHVGTSCDGRPTIPTPAEAIAFSSPPSGTCPMPRLCGFGISTASATPGTIRPETSFVWTCRTTVGARFRPWCPSGMCGPWPTGPWQSHRFRRAPASNSGSKHPTVPDPGTSSKPVSTTSPFVRCRDARPNFCFGTGGSTIFTRSTAPQRLQTGFFYVQHADGALQTGFFCVQRTHSGCGCDFSAFNVPTAAADEIFPYLTHQPPAAEQISARSTPPRQPSASFFCVARPDGLPQTESLFAPPVGSGRRPKVSSFPGSAAAASPPKAPSPCSRLPERAS